MMSGQLNYQDFGSDVPAKTAAKARPQEELEDVRLQAFENGYQAGWDDSAKAQHDLDHTVSAALAANLQDASFQYHETRKQLTGTVQEMMQAIVDLVLPDMARQSLGARVVQLVEAHARNALDGQIELRVHETAFDQVEAVLSEKGDQYVVKADPKVAPDQACILVDKTEHAVDLGQLIQDIKTTVAEFFEAQTSENTDDRPS